MFLHISNIKKKFTIKFWNVDTRNYKIFEPTTKLIMSLCLFSSFWGKIIKVNIFFFFMILTDENFGKILATDISDTIKIYTSYLSFKDRASLSHDFKILLTKCSTRANIEQLEKESVSGPHKNNKRHQSTRSELCINA